ncbi:MAG: aminopeptidase N [Alphaproteobacteria bacterium]|nr:aminopeptidase N [Alphaproteobacteria bacterium]
MKTDSPKTIYLKDYKPYPYALEHVDLSFDIHEGYTIVHAKMDFTAPDHCREDIFLNGEHLELMELKLDGEVTTDFTKDDKGLTLPCPHKKAFTLEITTRIKPENNTRLEGLYKSGGTYCTQCEAEGFRTITYYPDRPDVMTKFTVRIEADKKHYPVLLSNGNRIDHGEAEHGRHYALWHDPFPKPCYLFALVAGDLAVVEDEFTTKSGRKVELYIYVRPGDEGQCAHAMDSLKKSMAWDEETYGLEYDLDLFNIVAVSDFNMGAMENKSLNIFNTALVLAHQDTATDADFLRVESVIAHEYFHNWSGNRVTCRDWFQLSLKEGLTVFRDQEFSADLNCRTVQRIDDVTHLRRLQFPEDAGPLAHPIRPDNYIEINNFYTMTVYEKGAEVIRMIRTILGPENYRKGTDLYFSRHDGQAVTCDDFVQAMEDASGISLTQFRLWYQQAGTPEVAFRGVYNEGNGTYTVELSQIVPDTPGQTDKKPMHIPVEIGLLDGDGKDIKTETLHLTEEKQSFVLDGVPSAPIPSVLRNFSAPINLVTELSDENLAFLMRHDSDGFNRWEAGQRLFLKAINAFIDEGAPYNAGLIEAAGTLLEEALEPDSDKAFLARAIMPPSVSFIGQGRAAIAPVSIYAARQKLLHGLKREHRKTLDRLYKDLSDEESNGAFSISPEAMGRRALRNVVLAILSSTHGTGCTSRSKAHYDNAANMTDRVAALSVIADIGRPEREEAFADFYDHFKTYPLVVDKWFALQAGAVRDDIIQNLNKLKQHSDFNIKNPNRVRSLYASFAMNNPTGFHAADGSGYAFLADAVIELNSINPQIAARLLTPLREWRRYTTDRQEHMKAALERILAEENLSPDVYEIAGKSLKG